MPGAALAATSSERSAGAAAPVGKLRPQRPLQTDSNTPTSSRRRASKSPTTAAAMRVPVHAAHGRLQPRRFFAADLQRRLPGSSIPNSEQIRPADLADRLVRRFGSPPIHLCDYGGGRGRLAELVNGAGGPQGDVLGTRFSVMVRSRSNASHGCRSRSEHSPTPAETFADMLSLANDDRVVPRSAPLCQPEQIRAAGMNWWYCVPRNGHISLHTRRSLQHLADQAGIGVIHPRTVPTCSTTCCRALAAALAARPAVDPGRRSLRPKPGRSGQPARQRHPTMPGAFHRRHVPAVLEHRQPRRRHTARHLLVARQRAPGVQPTAGDQGRQAMADSRSVASGRPSSAVICASNWSALWRATMSAIASMSARSARRCDGAVPIQPHRAMARMPSRRARSSKGQALLAFRLARLAGARA